MLIILYENYVIIFIVKLPKADILIPCKAFPFVKCFQGNFLALLVIF